MFHRRLAHRGLTPRESAWPTPAENYSAEVRRRPQATQLAWLIVGFLRKVQTYGKPADSISRLDMYMTLYLSKRERLFLGRNSHLLNA